MQDSAAASCLCEVSFLWPSQAVDNLVWHSALSDGCSKQQKDATKQAPRHPPLPLQEAAESLSGSQPKADGRVSQGRIKPRNDGLGGRFYLNVTGFPFPLGPVFARQTVRTEVQPHACCSSSIQAWEDALPAMQTLLYSCVAASWPLVYLPKLCQ